MNMDIFSNKTLQEFTDCVFWFIQDQDELAKRYKSRSYCLPKCVIKNYNAISWKNFYDQPIGSDIKRYKDIRKLTTGQGEHYEQVFSRKCNGFITDGKLWGSKS